MLRKRLAVSLILLAGLAVLPALAPWIGSEKPIVLDFSSRFEKFEMKTCQLDHCFQLKAAKAVESQVFKSTSFTDGEFTLLNAEKKTSFKAEGHYDRIGQKIYFTQVFEQPFAEAWYDLKTQKLVIL